MYTVTVGLPSRTKRVRVSQFAPLMICSQCKQDKTTNCFYPDARRKSGFRNPCRLCSIARVRSYRDRWRNENRTKYNLANRNAVKKRRYGISTQDLLILLQKQDNGCAICNRFLSVDAIKKIDRPYIDHCHATGVVRGLLCSTCNSGIGLLNDSPKLLASAIKYLLRGAPTVKSILPATASVSADSSNSETIH